MRKSEANRIAQDQLADWLEKHRDPGVLPCVPIIMINSLCGDKPGVSMNFAEHLPLPTALQILQACCKQVEARIAQMESVDPPVEPV